MSQEDNNNSGNSSGSGNVRKKTSKKGGGAFAKKSKISQALEASMMEARRQAREQITERVLDELTAENARTPAGRRVLFQAVRDMLAAYGGGNELKQLNRFEGLFQI
jgi:hypothetical protein